MLAAAPPRFALCGYSMGGRIALHVALAAPAGVVEQDAVAVAESLGAFMRPVLDLLRVGEPGAGRWLDSNTFVFNESVVANEEGLRQIEFVLNGLGIELVTTHSPGWMDTINDGNWGTSHADMFLMVPDHRVAVLAPQLVNYGFVRYLMREDWNVIEVPPEEYWDLACNAVTLAPGKVVMNAGSPKVVAELERNDVEVGNTPNLFLQFLNRA